MAIEMIEQCELPAVAQRQDNYIEHYSTENNDLKEATDGYASATGISLMGNLWELNKSNKAMKAEDSKIAIISAVNKSHPIPANNCEALITAKTKLDNEVYLVNQQILAGDKAKTKKDYLNALNARLTIIKTKMSDLKCIEIEQEQELKKNQEDVLAALSAAKSGGVPETATDKMNKYILWGIAGIMVVTAIVILLKKKKSE